MQPMPTLYVVVRVSDFLIRLSDVRQSVHKFWGHLLDYVTVGEHSLYVTLQLLVFNNYSTRLCLKKGLS